MPLFLHVVILCQSRMVVQVHQCPPLHRSTKKNPTCFLSLRIAIYLSQLFFWRPLCAFGSGVGERRQKGNWSQTKVTFFCCRGGDQDRRNFFFSGWLFFAAPLSLWLIPPSGRERATSLGVLRDPESGHLLSPLAGPRGRDPARRREEEASGGDASASSGPPQKSVSRPTDPSTHPLIPYPEANSGSSRLLRLFLSLWFDTPTAVLSSRHSRHAWDGKTKKKHVLKVAGIFFTHCPTNIGRTRATTTTQTLVVGLNLGLL